MSRQGVESRTACVDSVHELRQRHRERVHRELPAIAASRQSVLAHHRAHLALFEKRCAREFDDVLRVEPRDQFLRCAEGDAFAVVDDGDAIAKAFRLVHVMRRKQNGSTPLTESLHDVPQLQTALRIEAARGLVEEQDVRLADESTRDSKTLFLTAGEFSNAGIQLLVEREVVQQIAGIRPVPIEGAEQPQRLEHGELLAELRFLQRDAHALAQLSLMLLPREAENTDLASVRRVDPFEDLDRRRLARAVRPEQPEALPTTDLQIEAVDGLDVRVMLAQPYAGNRQFRHARDTIALRIHLMHAIVVQPNRSLSLEELPSPVLGPDDLRIQVRATSVNRADLLQRAGQYPPPPGASPILGLECAGVVTEVGANVRGWSRGRRAMALLPGGGYAQEVVVHAGSAMLVPDALTDEEAAALPEVFLTAFLNLFQLARVRQGERVLIHGGGSGVGTAATTLCKLAGATVLVTAGSREKCEACLAHGADIAINYREEDFVARAQGVNVILDHIGARYLPRDLDALALDGRVVIIGSMGGERTAEIDVMKLLGKRLQILGSTLRARPVDEKASIVRAFLDRFGPDLQAGRIRPVIHNVLPLERADDAHDLMESSEHFGKIVLTC
jgi:tumor protein p53-inducible protein 3